MGNCPKCGKSFGLYSTKYSSGTLYDAEMGFELSLNDRYPENPYREKNLCKKCYEEVYENAPELPVEKSLGSMGNCAKCGKQLSLLDSQRKLRGKDVSPEFYNKPLCFSCYEELTKVNRRCPHCGTEFGFLAFNLQKWVSKDIHPEWIGRLLHPDCVEEAIKMYEASRKELIACENCFYYRLDEDSRTIDTGIFVPNYKVYTITSQYCTKFGFSLKKNCEEAEKCTSYITPEEYKEKALSGEMNKDKANVQIILDFSSLKEVMSKGGLVMSTYKCPNCSGMVDIPEVGKLLMCKYCGTPIKPVDIFEKINSLIQSDVYSRPVHECQKRPNQVHSKFEPEYQRQSNQSSPCRTCSKPVDSDELSRNEGICDDCWDNAKMKEDSLS